ncbi:MAG: hypothetical protein H8D46_03435 [FCB group bacterium]|nr:hypothetical protein [FCB group bacterium]
MILEADTDNNGEDDNPYIEFRQDGGTKSCIGRSGATDGYYTDQIANSFYMYNTSVGAGIQFATGSTPASRMYIDQTGNVGIGTTSPTEQLEVSGNLKVTGSFIGNADYIWIQDEKTSGTTSGTCTPGTWAKRNLTIEKSDTGGHATLSSDQIVLVAGTYHVRASAIGYRTNRHQARLYNATDASTIIVGSSEYSDSGGAVSNRSSIIGQFTLSVSKTLELQHRCQVNSATTDFGQPTSFGESEVYAIIELWRIAN